MERQAEQLLRKGAGGDFSEAGKAGCPVPGSDSEYLHCMPARQALAATQAVEVMVKLVREENRHGAADFTTPCAVPGEQPVQPANGGKVERDGGWSGCVIGIDNDAAESRILIAMNYRYVASRRNDCRNIAPPVAGTICKRMPIV